MASRVNFGLLYSKSLKNKEEIKFLLLLRCEEKSVAAKLPKQTELKTFSCLLILIYSRCEVEVSRAVL